MKKLFPVILAITFALTPFVAGATSPKQIQGASAFFPNGVLPTTSGGIGNANGDISALTFTPSGANTPLPLSAFTKRFLTPESCGAKGDGTTLDTAAFQRCNDLLNAQGGGVILPDPTKKYVLGGANAVNLDSHVVVDCTQTNGGGSLFLQASSTAPAMFQTRNYLANFLAGTHDGTVPAWAGITRCHLVGNKASQTQAVRGFQSYQTRPILVEDYIENFSGNGAVSAYSNSGSSSSVVIDAQEESFIQRNDFAFNGGAGNGADGVYQGYQLAVTGPYDGGVFSIVAKFGYSCGFINFNTSTTGGGLDHAGIIHSYGNGSSSGYSDGSVCGISFASTVSHAYGLFVDGDDFIVTGAALPGRVDSLFVYNGGWNNTSPVQVAANDFWIANIYAFFNSTATGIPLINWTGYGNGGIGNGLLIGNGQANNTGLSVTSNGGRFHLVTRNFNGTSNNGVYAYGSGLDIDLQCFNDTNCFNYGSQAGSGANRIKVLANLSSGQTATAGYGPQAGDIFEAAYSGASSGGSYQFPGSATFNGAVSISGTALNNPLTISSSNTVGTQFALANTSTGGHNYQFFSGGSSNGPGNFGVFDATANSTPFLVNNVTAANPVVSTVAGGIIGFSSATQYPSGTADTAITRCAAGTLCVGTGAQGNANGLVESGAFVSAGTPFTASGCGVTSLTGGATAGSMASGTTGTCTVTFTFAKTAPHGWNCSANDNTAATAMPQSANSTTTCTIKGATTSGDSITFNAVGF